MHTAATRHPSTTAEHLAAHQWVGAALVGLGHGDNRRAEHAARTERHVLPARTRIEVLEVYCARCRMPYSDRACNEVCSTRVLRAG